MRTKRKLLTAKQFERLSRISGWEVYEIPPEDWGVFADLTRREDTIALMGSFDIYDPRIMNEVKAVMGIDQLVHETKPKVGEPEGNAYHFVVQQTNHSVFPYVIHGPFPSETRVRHRFSYNELDEYFKKEVSKKPKGS